MMRKTLDSTRLDYEKEMERLRHLQQQRMKQQALVKHFENSNEVYYIKIRKTVEEKVVSILSYKKMLLKLALLSLTESMRKDPDKYSSIIYYDNKSLSWIAAGYYTSQYYAAASNTYGPPQSSPPQQQEADYVGMLLEEAEKLYEGITKEIANETIDEYISKTSSSSSLPMLSSEQQP